MELMSLKEARRVLELYPSLSVRDRLTILARLIFCVGPIIHILEQYLPEKGIILDLGCGYGIISHLVSDACPDRSVIGVDMSARRIGVAKGSIRHRRNLEFRMVDIRDVQFPRCDAFMAIDVLYMFPYQDQERILTRCYEKLTPRGVLVVKDNSKSPYWKYMYAHAEEFVKTRWSVYGKNVRNRSLKYWDVGDFLKLLGRIGFHAIAIPLRSYLPYPGVFYICHKSACS